MKDKEVEFEKLRQALASVIEHENERDELRVLAVRQSSSDVEEQIKDASDLVIQEYRQLVPLLLSASEDIPPHELASMRKTFL